jgi:hypothetical protein
MLPFKEVFEGSKLYHTLVMFAQLFLYLIYITEAGYATIQAPGHQLLTEQADLQIATPSK